MCISYCCYKKLQHWFLKNYYYRFWMCWLFVVAHRLLHCRVRALEWEHLVVVALRLSCSMACGILVPWPGSKPMSPALQVGFSTTGRPGKFLQQWFKTKQVCSFIILEVRSLKTVSAGLLPFGDQRRIHYFAFFSSKWPPVIPQFTILSSYHYSLLLPLLHLLFILISCLPLIRALMITLDQPGLLRITSQDS